MKDKGILRHRILFGLLLILLSIFFYAVHYAAFRDLHHILIFLIGDIAFVFLEVLLVTLILHQLLNDREPRSMLKKLNKVIGAFFCAVGTPLLPYFRDFDKAVDAIMNRLAVDGRWSHEQFEQMRDVLIHHKCEIDPLAGDLAHLREFLIRERQFLLGLLENPNLLEHEEFTELMWAVFHLADELSHRTTVVGLAKTDYEHLAGDIARAYSLLLREWISHLEHLKISYPYLFSLALRTNPFDPDASAEVA